MLTFSLRVFSLTCRIYVFREICTILKRNAKEKNMTIWVGFNRHTIELTVESLKRILLESDSTICCIYTVYPPEDEHLRLETCRWK